MPRRFILLCGQTEAQHFKAYLRRFDPRFLVRHADSVEALERLVDRFGGDARLIAFLTDIIVPGSILRQLKQTPYNIHPGPPEFPGAHPTNFAIWEKATSYGVTAHEIAPRVDEGAIVGVRRFAIPPNTDHMALNDLTYGEAVNLFAVIAARCAMTQEPLRRLDAAWSGHKRTRADFASLCQTAPMLNATSLIRHRLACGDQMSEPAQVSQSVSHVSARRLRANDTHRNAP